MRFQISTLVGLARFLMLLLFIHACASTSLIEKQQSLCPKCKDPHRYVRVHAWPGGQQGIQITHSFHLTSQDWARVLNNIHVQNSSTGFLFFETKGSVSQAFTPDEVDYLSTTLSKAFAQTQPDQLVVFGLSRVRSHDLIEVTTGGWYAKGAYIHLLLANYRQSVTMPNILERLWRNPLVSGITPVFDLVPGEQQKLGTSTKSLNGLIKSDIPDLSIDYKPLLAKSGNEENRAPTTAPDDQGSSLEQRLRTLMRFKEKGLITEQEFLEKRKKLLENF